MRLGVNPTNIAVWDFHETRVHELDRDSIVMFVLCDVHNRIYKHQLDVSPIMIQDPYGHDKFSIGKIFWSQKK
jgi:hypothetical protein